MLAKTTNEDTLTYFILSSLIDIASFRRTGPADAWSSMTSRATPPMDLMLSSSSTLCVAHRGDDVAVVVGATSSDRARFAQCLDLRRRETPATERCLGIDAAGLRR